MAAASEEELSVPMSGTVYFCSSARSLSILAWSRSSRCSMASLRCRTSKACSSGDIAGFFLDEVVFLGTEGIGA